jgi:hypothetical protein
MQVLEQEFGLMKVCTRGQDAVRAALELADNPPSRQQIAAQRAALVQRLEYIPEVIERHVQALAGGTYG